MYSTLVEVVLAADVCKVEAVCNYYKQLDAVVSLGSLVAMHPVPMYTVYTHIPTIYSTPLVLLYTHKTECFGL